MRSQIVTAAVLAALAAAPAGAAAQTTTTPTPTTPTTPTTPMPPPPVQAGGRLGLKITRAPNFAAPAVFSGQRIHVHGFVRPFIPGQSALVSIYRSGHVIIRRTRPIVSVAANTGVIDIGFRSARLGVVTAVATHYATPLQRKFTAHTKSILVVPRHAFFGERGLGVRLLQQLLAHDHFSVPLNGVYDGGTGRAVDAFRRLSGLPRNELADQSVFGRLIHGGGRFHPRYRHQGAHFEADLGHQVLAEVNPNGRVRRVYMMSSGKPSTPTVIGNFRVYSQTSGTNSHGMVDSNYFISGYAIHGYADVPDYAASHGCLRIPIPDAASVFQWAKIGMAVDVYYPHGGGSHHVRGNAGP